MADSVSKASSLKKDEKTCLICFERPPNSAFMPCGHGCVCDKCAVEIFDEKGVCPMCRVVLAA